MTGFMQLMLASASPVAAAVTDSTPTGAIFTPEPAPLTTLVTSNSTTASGTGGNGSYTYSWAYVSGDAGISVSNASAATVTFSATCTKNAGPRTGVWRVTVSDGNTSDTEDVSISLAYTSDA